MPPPGATVGGWAVSSLTLRHIALQQRASRTSPFDQRSSDRVKARPSNREQNRPPPSEPILPSSLVAAWHGAGSRESGGAPALSDCERLALWTATATTTSAQHNRSWPLAQRSSTAAVECHAHIRPGTPSTAAARWVPLSERELRPASARERLCVPAHEPRSDRCSDDGVKARPSNRAQNRPPPSEPILLPSFVVALHGVGSRESGGASALSDCERLALRTATVTTMSVKCK